MFLLDSRMMKLILICVLVFLSRIGSNLKLKFRVFFVCIIELGIVFSGRIVFFIISDSNLKLEFGVFASMIEVRIDSRIIELEWDTTLTSFIML
jgi:hypothetical protein